MTIQCPSCVYAGDIDLTRLPNEGATIECPKCGAKVRVDKAGITAERQKTSLSRPRPSSTEKQEITASDKENAAARAVNKPSFHGTGGTLFGIFIINILLSILTLGIYKFWGKTKIRKYLYGQTELMGERFAYHGTGKELFIGWIKAMLLLALAYLGVIILTRHVSRYFALTVPVAVPFLIAFVIVASTRYRLSRSSWRGVRFSFRGSARRAILMYASGYFLSVATLGLYIPFFHVKRREFWLENTYYGSSAFEYEGSGRELLNAMFFPWLLTVLTLGVYGFWYSAKLDRYDWAHTRFDSLRFQSTETGASLFALYLTNILLVIFSIALALPWVMTRTMRYRTGRLAVVGDIDFEKIKQDTRPSKTIGEGFADALNIDAGLI